MLVSLYSADDTNRRASSEKASERASERKTVYYFGAWNRLNVKKTLSCLHSCSSSRFNMDGDQIPRSNFDSFWRAVITVFQVRKWYSCIFVWSFFSSSWQKKIRGKQLEIHMFSCYFFLRELIFYVCWYWYITPRYLAFTLSVGVNVGSIRFLKGYYVIWKKPVPIPLLAT